MILANVVTSKLCLRVEIGELTKAKLAIKLLEILQDAPDKGSPGIEDIVSYPWCIDTRYYTAEIQLCSTKYRTIGNAEFAKKLEAFIVHFNTQQESSFEKVKLWLPYLKEIDPEIRLLVCNTCSHTDAVSREAAWKWCLENAFELVELDPEIEEHSDEEDDFQETTGIKRIIQALHSHSWENLVMKDNPSFRSSLMTQMMRDHAREVHSESTTQDSELNQNIELSASSGAHITTAANTEDQIPYCDISDLQNPFLDGLAVNHTKVNETEGFDDDFEPDFKSCTVLQSSSDHCEISESKDTAAAESSRLCQNSLSIKGNNKESTSVDNQVVNNASSRENNKQEEAMVVSEDKDKDVDTTLEDDGLQALAAFGSGETDPEAFEQLFDKLKIMKEQAELLPFDQRKQYAEKVAIQFWKAIGGNEDEIEGLSSDEEQA